MEGTCLSEGRLYLSVARLFRRPLPLGGWCLGLLSAAQEDGSVSDSGSASWAPSDSELEHEAAAAPSSDPDSLSESDTKRSSITSRVCLSVKSRKCRMSMLTVSLRHVQESVSAPYGIQVLVAKLVDSAQLKPAKDHAAL